MSPNSADERDGMLKFFCNHLVALGGTYVPLDSEGRDAGPEKFFAFSCFVISLGNSWYLVTAGHAVEDLENALQSRRVRLTNSNYADYFGSNPKVEEPTPFDYEGAEKLYIDDDHAGLDFALIKLRSIYRSGMEANGIQAFTEENWRGLNSVDCEIYMLIGLPSCLVPDPSGLVPYPGNRIAGMVSPTMVYVTAIELSPDELPPSRFPWFVGRVGGANGLPSIVGMSGGPIIGFAPHENARFHYWIVAIQSRWRKASRTIFACPVRTFLELAEDVLRDGETAG